MSTRRLWCTSWHQREGIISLAARGGSASPCCYPLWRRILAGRRNFSRILRLLDSKRTGKRVVILVDEYDKPMLQSIGDDALQEEFRSTLKEIYSVLKTQDRCIRFAFMTGVTKFGKVSVFSDLNNLNDISMDARFVDSLSLKKVDSGHFHFGASDFVRKKTCFSG